MKRSITACGILAFAATLLPAQQPAPRFDPSKLQGSQPIEIVFLRDHGPLMVRLHVLKDGQPLQARWQEYLGRWFDFLDRKTTGELDQVALAGAPSAASMRNLSAQGIFFPGQGQTLTLNDFGKSAGQKVTRKEFLEYYRKNNLTPIQTAIAPLEATGQANSALFKALDANGDGKLTRAEFEAASRALASFDADDDGLVALRELGPAGNPVNVRGIVTVTPAAMQPQPLKGTSFFHVSSESSRAGMAALLLAHYDKKKRMTLTQKDIGIDDAAFARLDENKNGSLDLMELAKFSQNGPAVEFVIQLRPGNQPPVAVAKTGAIRPESVRMNGSAVLLALGDADITVQNQDSGQVGFRINQFNGIAQQLKAADTKMRGYVELSDLQGPQMQFLRNMFAVLDRNEDGKLIEQEAQTYFDLQSGSRELMTSFSVQEQGRSLLQILDANRDGQLSPRELLNAWTRLAPFDKNGDGVIDANELPLQFRIAFNPIGGQAQFTVVAGGMVGAPARGGFNYPSHAPLWFRKMDRNGDGDVSPREFLGTPEEFRLIDRNGDGLIDADEAAALTQRK